MLKFVASVALVLSTVATSAQSITEAELASQCGNTSGKVLSCCRRVVKANPKISQCAKERAVFDCAGSKTYTSTNGCGTFTRK